MTPEDSLKEFVKQRLNAAAQQIFNVFQHILDRYQDETQRQRQLLDVILKPECRSSRAEPPHKSGDMVEEVEVCKLRIRQEGEPLAGSHCDVGEEFVKQRVCAAADDLWSLLESVFTGQQAESEGRGPGGPRPRTEPPLLPVCKEEEAERSCSVTPHMKEEFCSTRGMEQQLQEEEEATLTSTLSDEDRGRGTPNSEQQFSSHHQTGSEDVVHPAVLMSESQRTRLLISSHSPTTTTTHHNSRNHFVDEELTAAVDDIFSVLERFLCSSTEKWEHQHPLLAVVRNSHQSRTARSQQQKSTVDRKEGERLCIKQEEVEEDPSSSRGEEQLLLKRDTCPNINQTKSEPHSSKPSLSGNSHGVGSCQTGSDVTIERGTSTRPSAPKTKKTFKCETCGKTSRRRYLHLQHVRTHTGEKPYTCETCGNSFNQKSALNQHVRTHTGEKPFLCKTCGRTFGQASSLRAHRVTHTDEKPHECRFCGMTFALLERLIRHTRVHTDERPYACQVCGRSFRQSTSLSVHLRVHSGERPYQCGFCGKGFVDKSGVNAHQKIHLGEKPHRCRTCGKFFRNSNQLKIHTRIHTGEKPFTCRSCGRSFNQLASFQKHLETHGDHMTRDHSPSFDPEDTTDCAPCL